MVGPVTHCPAPLCKLPFGTVMKTSAGKTIQHAHIGSWTSPSNKIVLRKIRKHGYRGNLLVWNMCKPLKFHLRSVLLRILLMISCLHSLPAKAAEIYFAEPKSVGQQAKRIIASLELSTTSHLQHPIKSVSTEVAGNLSGQTNLVIALGPESLDKVLSGSGSAPVIAVFVSKTSFESIQAKHKSRKNRSVSAIFSDPDPIKQVALIKALYGPSASAVLINSPAVQTYISGYQAAAEIIGVKLNIVNLRDIKSTSDFIRASRNAVSLLLLKDQDLMERVSLEKILILSYEINHQGVIGYSRGLVKNGGAATTYSSLDNIAHAIYLQTNQLQDSQSIDPPHYTTSFGVFLNKHVLRSLDIVNLDEDTVQNRIASMIKGGTKK